MLDKLLEKELKEAQHITQKQHLTVATQNEKEIREH